MNEIKHQHFVPRFYLKQFASEADQIWVFDKTSDRSFRSAVRNVAGEHRFYDSEAAKSAVGDHQAVERILANIEKDLAPRMTNLVNRLRRNEFRRLHEETRMAIALFAALQMFRTPENRLEHKHGLKNLIGFLKRFPGTEQLRAEMEEACTDRGLQELHVAYLLRPKAWSEFAAVLDSHIWVLKRRVRNSSFYTSDNPVTRRPNDRTRSHGTTGIASKGIEIHIPISHDFLATLYERSFFKNLAHLDGQLVDLKCPEEMVYYRQMAARQSTRFVYCLEDDFAVAREICRREPYWRDPERPRFEAV